MDIKSRSPKNAKGPSMLAERVVSAKITSRERPKSRLYLRLKKIRKRKPLFLQLETTKALKKQIFFEVSSKSHSAEKCKRWDALGFFEHPFCCKISKIDGRNNKKNFGKNQSHSAEKRRKVS